MFTKVKGGATRWNLAFPVFAIMVGIFAVLVPFFIDRRFFYIDDKQTLFVPYVNDIATALVAGDLPFLSLSTVFGGNYGIDWQFGLLNP